MIKNICSLDEMNKVMKQSKLAIYGAGNTAKHVLKYASDMAFKIERIYVSYKENNPIEIMGVPVKSVYGLTQNEVCDICLLVCVTEKWQNEVREVIAKYSFQDVIYISDGLIREIIYQNADYDVQISEAVTGIQKSIDWQTDRILRFVPKPCLEYMIVHILDHCNLRCKGCDHFACIAEEKFIPYKTIHRDIKRLSEIFNRDYIIKIAVMGGEPLLHPELKEILKDIRKYFPNTIIRLTTNGILLLKQDEEFWKICRENNVLIVNTKYPINLDFKAIEEKAKNSGVEYKFFEGTEGEYVKHSFKKVINLKGDSNPTDSFSKCHISNYGNMVLDGKFYACAFSAQSYRIFNKKFNQNLRLTEEDYIDIYKVNDKEDFFKFAAKPKYYCRYCQGISQEFTWERSKQEISEWVEINNV